MSLCVSSFKWHCGTPYFPLHIVLNVQTAIKLNDKGLEKSCIANEGATHPL
jgi:hypothetical protein